MSKGKFPEIGALLTKKGEEFAHEMNCVDRLCSCMGKRIEDGARGILLSIGPWKVLEHTDNPDFYFIGFFMVDGSIVNDIYGDGLEGFRRAWRVDR